MIHNVITFKNGDKQKADGKYTEAELRKACELKGLEVEKIERLGLVGGVGYDESKKLYFKVIWGFEDERETSIEEKDLIKALYAMSAKVKVYLGDILLDGKYIIAVKEDYNKTMNWNPSHELQNDDWNELRARNIPDLFTGKIYEAKEKVQEAISKNDLSLLKGNLKQLN